MLIWRPEFLREPAGRFRANGGGVIRRRTLQRVRMPALPALPPLAEWIGQIQAAPVARVSSWSIRASTAAASIGLVQ